jgi:hypothetical protein
MDTGLVSWVEDPAAGPHSNPPRRQPVSPVVADPYDWSGRATGDVTKHVCQLERAGESEWTPWIAIAALILFYAAIGLLMFGIVEAASHVLASASSLSAIDAT